MSKYTVFYEAEYDVEADNDDDALQIALEMHASLPDGVWTVNKDDEQF